MLLGVFKSLCFPVAMDKLEGPACHLTFWGFEFDLTMEICLLAQKLVEQQQMCQWRSFMRQDLQSLVGKLAHARAVVPPGKTFL